MATHPIIAPPPDETEASNQKAGPSRDRPTVVTKDKAPAPAPVTSRRHELFEESLLDTSPTRPRSRVLDFSLSLFFHAFVLTTLVFSPLFFTEAIDIKEFTQTLLVAPPPPPPPPPVAPTLARRPSALRRVFFSGGKLLAPMVIPERVAMVKEEPIPDEPRTGAGVVGGVPGGVPGGQLGGVIGGIIGGMLGGRHVPPPPASPVTKTPIRVGGRIRAPLALFKPQPVYPALAKQARIEGDVLMRPWSIRKATWSRCAWFLGIRC